MNKWIGISLGTLVGVSHLGMIGIIASRQTGPDIPPVGPYTSFAISKDKNGYKMSYQANDPKTMYKTTSIDQKGLFKKYNRQVAEQYTMDGAKHLQGGGLGQLTAKKVECIKAEGGGENAGRMVGATAGAALAPTILSIPYIGWLAAGWVAMFAQDKGADIGGDVATMLNDCEEVE